MKILKYLILLLASLLIVFTLYFILNQDNYIYFPDRAISRTPASAGLDYEGVYLKSEDGVQISGWFVPAQESRGTVLFCHGNARNISTRVELLKMFNELNVNIFIFDYRGYGESEGEPSEGGTYMDSEAAYNYLVNERGISPSEIIVLGRSLGGAIGARLASKYPVKALILDSAFTSIKDMGAPIHLIIPAKLFSRFQYKTEEYIKGLDMPILIIHSRDDEIVPFSHGKELYKTASEPKFFVEIEGSHSSGYIESYDKYKKAADDFLQSF